ncbi:MAG: GNAT family N-acetyltransferase [Alphaproteobacteria bacterium]|nr:MAG: GNAT family N-acetyltransferase [Alphaproteobacteria bacterium]
MRARVPGKRSRTSTSTYWQALIRSPASRHAAVFSSLTITPATAEDIPALITLAANAFGDAVRPLAVTEFPTGLQAGTRSPLVLLVAKQAGSPIGMVGLLQDFTYPDTYCLSWLAVAHAYRRQGLGTALIHAALQAAGVLISGSVGTVILATSESNRAYYTRHGFTGGTPLHAHPHHPEPHVLLALPITKAVPQS